MAAEQGTVYELVGGMEFFERLVGRFYDEVEKDEVLLRLYPDRDDLGPARERLTLFLAQYWGGPTTYSDERGHPRLRMRHMPFAIGPTERDHWLRAMRAALDELDPPGIVRIRFETYFDMTADSMRNQD
ncbi:MAG TPA: globin [Microthrixaceae bacterium]|nr:globin [Microthrixaceae bacterium]